MGQLQELRSWLQNNNNHMIVNNWNPTFMRSYLDSSKTWVLWCSESGLILYCRTWQVLGWILGVIYACKVPYCPSIDLIWNLMKWRWESFNCKMSEWNLKCGLNVISHQQLDGFFSQVRNAKKFLIPVSFSCSTMLMWFVSLS